MALAVGRQWIPARAALGRNDMALGRSRPLSFRAETKSKTRNPWPSQLADNGFRLALRLAGMTWRSSEVGDPESTAVAKSVIAGDFTGSLTHILNLMAYHF